MIWYVHQIHYSDDFLIKSGNLMYISSCQFDFTKILDGSSDITSHD